MLAVRSTDQSARLLYPLKIANSLQKSTKLAQEKKLG